MYNLLYLLQSCINFRWLPEILELVDELRNKVDGKNNPPRKEIPLTKVQEFNLTKPKARSVPLPQPVSVFKITYHTDNCCIITV